MTDEQKFEANIQNEIPLLPPPPPSGFVTTGAAVADAGTAIERVAIISSLVALVGSFLPWARVFFITINETGSQGSARNYFGFMLSAIPASLCGAGAKWGLDQVKATSD
jgi:hypothetical protein